MNDTSTNDTNGPHDMNSNDNSNGFGCDSFAEELSLFVFGELEGEKLAELEKHLVGCAGCRSERDALQRSLALLKSDGANVGEPQLSADRQADLLAQAQAQVRAQTVIRASHRFARVSRFAVAAGLLATAGIGWYAWKELAPRAPDRCDLVADHASAAAPAERGPADGAFLANEARNYRGPPESTPPTKVFTLDGYATNKDELLDRKTVPVPEFKPDETAPDDFGTDPTGAAAPSAGAFFSDGSKHDLKARTENHLDEGEVPLSPPAPTPPAPTLLQKEHELGMPREKKLSLAHEGKPAAPAGQKVGTGLKRNVLRGATASRSLGAVAPDTGGPASSGASGSKLDVSAPLNSSGGASAAMPPDSMASGFETLPEDTPDIAGNPDTGISAVMTFVSGDSCAWMGADENASPDLVEKLRALGYLGNDAGGGAARAPLDPAVIGRLLAATCSPSQVVLFQKRLAAALGVDPAQPRADLDKDRDTIVREFLNQLSRRQNEPPHDMFFRYFGDHPFVSTRIDCKSTFGMDVDTASYTLARAYLTKGMLPPKAAIRTEEFVNAFKHGLTPPASDPRGDDHGAREGAGHDLAGKESTGRDVFAIHTEIAPSPFGDDGQLLLQVGLKARVISKAARKPVALTFIIDVSGSMAQDGRLELVKQSLHLLVDQLDERDSIGIVSFETTGHRVLAPTNAAHRALIYAALDQLRPEGSTNADEGLRFGYDMALEHLRPNAENRVILCSDGVANTGVTDPKTLSARIAECKSSHLYLNCVGVGMGNHNDALMEQLADEGDGFCAYLDRIEEAKKLFVDRLTGTLLTVARNAKIQVEFDPASVRRFRQIGYENRALAHRDFRNDKVDAGEVGAGQEVVALYEIEPKEKAAGPLATVRIRYEDPDAGPATAGAPTIREQARAVFTADVAPTLQKATPRFRLSACVAEFAEILRQSVHARDGSFGAVERLAEPLVDELRGDPDVPEFVALVQQAARLPDLLPPRNEMVRAVDELKKVRCWQEELRDSPNTNGAKDAADDALMRQLEEQNRRLEQALRDALDRALRHS